MNADAESEQNAPSASGGRSRTSTAGRPARSGPSAAGSDARAATAADPHLPGAKLDAGKLRAGLVLGGFARALSVVAEIGTHGAAKYSAGGWLHVANGHERYSDALWRHLLAEAAGQSCDPESGLLHAAHVAWNALARLDLRLREDAELRRIVDAHRRRAFPLGAVCTHGHAKRKTP